MMATLLRIEEGSKRFRPGRHDLVQALKSVSFSVAAGEALVLEGPSGSGKSTLLSLLGCMARPTSGRVILEEREVSRLPERFLTATRRENFGFIFQQLNLLPRLSVMENILLPLYPGTLSTAEMRLRAGALCDRYGLSALVRRQLRLLSGGEQQRVALARALINQPRVVIADEPTAHLDSELTTELLNHLQDLKRDGRTLIFATHDPRVSQHPLVDRRLRLVDGQLVDHP